MELHFRIFMTKFVLEQKKKKKHDKVNRQQQQY